MHLSLRASTLQRVPHAADDSLSVSADGSSLILSEVPLILRHTGDSCWACILLCRVRPLVMGSDREGLLSLYGRHGASFPVCAGPDSTYALPML